MNPDVSNELRTALYTGQNDAFISTIVREQLPPDYYDRVTGYRLFNMCAKMGNLDAMSKLCELFPAGPPAHEPPGGLPILLSCAHNDRADMLEFLANKYPALLDQTFQDKDLLWYCHYSAKCFEQVFQNFLAKFLQSHDRFVQSIAQYTYLKDSSRLEFLVQAYIGRYNNVQTIRNILIEKIPLYYQLSEAGFQVLCKYSGAEEIPRDGEGNTYLHLGIQHENPYVIKAWINMNLSVNYKNNQNMSPLDIFFSSNSKQELIPEFYDAISLLLANGARARIDILEQCESSNQNLAQMARNCRLRIQANNLLFCWNFTQNKFKDIKHNLIRTIMEDYVIGEKLQELQQKNQCVLQQKIEIWESAFLPESYIAALQIQEKRVFRRKHRFQTPDQPGLII